MALTESVSAVDAGRAGQQSGDVLQAEEVLEGALIEGAVHVVQFAVVGGDRVVAAVRVLAGALRLQRRQIGMLFLRDETETDINTSFRRCGARQFSSFFFLFSFELNIFDLRRFQLKIERKTVHLMSVRIREPVPRASRCDRDLVRMSLASAGPSRATGRGCGCRCASGEPRRPPAAAECPSVHPQ